MQKIALIDIGSNSIRMALYQIDDQYQVQEIQRYREFVQLAKNRTANGAINSANFQAGIQALCKFQTIIKSHQIQQVVATATEAVRKASNQSAFIQTAQQVADIKITVLTGQQEAYYDFLAVQQSCLQADFLFLDTGGGSFELGVVQQRQLQQTGSWPWGAVNLFDLLQQPQQLNAAQQSQIRRLILTSLQSISHKTISHLVMLGGVHRCLMEMIGASPATWLTRKQLQKWIVKIINNSLAENLKLSQMEPQRAPFMPVGLLPLATIMEHFQVQQVQFCRNGLREGILVEYIRQLKHQQTPFLSFNLKDNSLPKS